MANLTIAQMDIVADKPQIAEWDNLFKDSFEYDTIDRFILENGLIHGLGELIETNYEIVPIGNDETKHAFSVKDSTGQIVGFLIGQTYDRKTSAPTFFLQYIVLHPECQHIGYGTEIFQEFLTNSKKYLGVKPKNFFANVDENNQSSIHLFHKFGFTFPSRDPNFPNLIQAQADMPAIERAIQNLNNTWGG